MKKNKIYFFIRSIGLVIFIILSSGVYSQDDPLGGSCNGYITANVSGEINLDLCCDLFGNYNYQKNDILNFSAMDEQEIAYDIYINMNSNRGPFKGKGTYECGLDKSCLISLYTYDLDGNLMDTYVSVSGTITITTAEEFHFEAAFNVKAEDSEPTLKTINLLGSISK